MPRPSKPLVNRLLSSRNAMAAPDKELMLEQLLAASAPAASRKWWRPLIFAVPVVLALVLILLKPTEAEFTARGSNAPTLALACDPNPCALGGRLVLKPTAPQRYLSVVALGSDGMAIWYLTSADLQSPVMRSDEGILRTGISLDATHGPGSFEVVGVFTETPVTQEQVKAMIVDGESAAAIVRQKLSVAQ